MKSKGWISIHRDIIDSVIYKDSEAVHLWLHLLLSANHKENKKMIGHTIVLIPRGSLLTGRKSLSAATGIHESKIQRLLKLFEKNEQIEQQTFTKYRLVSITNYSEYQDSEQQLNSKRTTTEQQANTNNNVNNDNNVNKKEEKPKKPSPSKLNKPDNVEEEVWQDWLTLRKTKRAPVTNTVLKGAIKQAGIANISLNEFLQIWCRRGSQGLEASWIKPDERQNQAPPMRPLNGTGQADTRSRAQKVSDKLDEIARRDIEENGFTQSLD